MLDKGETAIPTRSRPPLPSAFVYAAIAAVSIPLAALTIGTSGSSIWSYLPTAAADLSYSFTRMLLAYTLSLGFSLAYGYYAAARPVAERVMIPILDILQSVPILGFFPVAIVFFVNLTGPSSIIGPNLASIFLIFTSMAWNMVFGVYESLKTLPSDLKEATASFNSRGYQRLRRVLVPATINRLVYNSILSWTAGWFFLVEAEIFTTNTHALAGIGSYLSFAAQAANGNKFIAGIILLVLLIAALDFLVWRPLSRWAERFRYDTAPSGEGEIAGPRDQGTRFRRAAAYVTRGVRYGVARVTTPFVQLAAITVRPGRRREPRSRRWVLSWVGLAAILVVGWLILIAIIVAVFHVFTQPIPTTIRAKIELLPLAMGASTLRVVAAYAICLAIALPLAIFLAGRPHAAKYGLPTVEVVASFPATALFPVIIFELLPYLSPEGASVLMLMTGMLWYLFFNILSGVRSLPPDLVEAAKSYGTTGWGYLRRVLLPGIFPALVTGSITAFGGGWNTLIVAEYLSVGTKTFQVFGVGQLLDLGYAVPNALALMTAALLTLVATVIVINELIWKPLYRRAVEKYRYD